jgi:hypothetical protein
VFCVEKNLLDILGRFSYRRGFKHSADPFCGLSMTDLVKEWQCKKSIGGVPCAAVPEIGVPRHGLGHRSGLLRAF